MNKKYYAVKKGKKVGIFDTWEETKKYVVGIKDAKYKSFKTKEEALLYLEDEYFYNKQILKEVRTFLNKGYLISFTDGSFDSDLNKSSWAAVLIENDLKSYKTISGLVHPKFNKYNNVAGEIYAAMASIKYAKKYKNENLIIFHDYEGVSNWATNTWQANTEISQYYLKFLKKYNKVNLKFYWVKGHSNVKYNEIADAIAKDVLNKLK